jgi:predicted short-subunit dehydrogenase-like oxidoreductase (DUF2520 family)
VGIVGFGRVGGVFAAALRAAGHEIAGVTARSAEAEDRAAAMVPGAPVLPAEAVLGAAEVIFITVSDDAIVGVVAKLGGSWRPGQLAVHASGALGLAALAPAAAAGAIPLAVHPALPFSGTTLDLRRLAGAPFAVTAAPIHLPIAEAIARDLGGVPFALEDSARPAYHAALAHAANHLTVLVHQSREALRGAGLPDPEAVLRPLAQAALDGALARGSDALTGPAARGDANTLALHARALGQLAARPNALPDAALTAGLYRVMARATLETAVRAGRITPAQAEAGRAALASVGDGMVGGDGAVDRDGAVDKGGGAP